MARTIMVVCSAALLVAYARANSENKAEPKGPAATLVGVYTIVAGEKNGQKEPVARIEGTTVTFTGDTITVTDKDKQRAYVAIYELDTVKKPWGITMRSTLPSSKGEEARGLIEKEGDTLKLIYALSEGERPTQFVTREKQLMFVMKPLKKE